MNSQKGKNVPEKHRMKFDAGQPFESVVHSDGAFRTCLEKLIESPQSREASREWARNLRLLSPLNDQARDTTDIQVQDASKGSKFKNPFRSNKTARPPPQPPSKDPQVTNLVLADCPLSKFARSLKPSNYVAISYCWNREGSNNYTKEELEGTIYVHSRGKETRKAKAPTVVLQRGINFALAHNMKSIWIDQECINQNVREDAREDERENARKDKELGIQAMDLVYENAPISVGLLTCFIQTQGQINALEQFLTDTVDFKKEQSDLLDVLTILANDEWFTRAWTFQEAIASGDHMSILIRHKPDLKKNDRLMGKMTGEIELSLETLGFKATVRQENIDYLAKFGDDANLRKHRQELKKVLSKLHDICPQKIKGYIYDGVTALQYLERRKNRRAPDRAAILANLCDYSQRINTIQAEEHQISLSVCLYLLCIMNGDLSLVTCHRNIHPSQRLGYSWGPHRKESIRSAIYNGFEVSEWGGNPPRLVRPILSKQGLHLSGWIWKIGEKLDLSHIKQQTHNDQGMGYNSNKMWHILTDLVDRGFKTIAELVWSSLDLTKHLEFNSTKHTWEQKRAHFEKHCDTYSQEVYRPLIAITQSGTISLGYRESYARRKTQSSPDKAKYQAIFYSKMDVGAMVLTPELAGIQEGETHRSLFSPVAWELDNPSAPILKAKSQSSGVYSTQDPSKQYTLA
ncbi:hypothetical protein LT330_006146 [Penicillium expansum]|nr:hypothetical protein LT330_006146 [Penicillium expansum]